MPNISTPDLLANTFIWVLLKWAILLILTLYAIFALVIIRQVDLMGKTLITKVSPLLKAIAIVHAGIAIGLIVLAFGIL